MVFAAGFGKRMGHLTADRPKPMISVAGRPLIDHALDLATDYGAERIVANVHYKPEMLIAHLKARNVAVSHEHPDILDTGGGLRSALPLLQDDTVFTLNTDAVWRGPNPLTHLANLWEPRRMDALLLCIPKPQALGHSGPGDFLTDGETPARRGPGDVYSGLQIIKTAGLSTIQNRVFSLNLLWDQMLADGRLFTTAYPGQWCDVGRPEGIALAEDMLGQSHV